MMDHEAEAVQARMHRIIATALRVGLTFSGLLALLALALGGPHLLKAGKPSLELGGYPRVALASATLSLLVLAATPALRVVLLGALWARQRDWRFVLIALAVAGVLATSVLLGRAG